MIVLAKATLKITKTKTKYKTSTKYKIPKSRTSSKVKEINGSKKGNKNHCPVCGKFI